ncbi:MAG: TetR/AcrR family transcriptional regulator [Marmoricola sp.]
MEGARARARREVTAAITTEARRQLAVTGAGGLSLRAVARELGMVSSALYRYFPSRDELLTALIVEAYDALGADAEEALAATVTASPLERWVAVCRAVRRWALGHPEEYALVYGSPVPGYAAPQDTVAPASRVGLALVEVLRDAGARGALVVPAGAGHGELPPALHADAAQLLHALGASAGELPVALVPAMVAAWAQLFGLVSFELFGQLHNVVEARDAFFDRAATGLAAQVGLTPA